MLNVYEQVDQNKQKSALIIALFIGFIALFAWVLGEASGYGLSFVGWGLILSGMLSFGSYYYSDKIILTLSKARPADRKKDFHFYTVTENLCLAMRLPKPKLYVIDDTAMNAFATGRDPQHAVVCATTGILSRLNRTELEGVIAHELSHIQNYDTRLMSVVAILVGMVTLAADFFLRSTRFRSRDNKQAGQIQMIMFVVGLVLALLSPIIAKLIQLAISRRREFLADASGVKVTRFPDGLARALEKISKDTEPLEVANKATAHLYITNPLKNHHDSVGWFASMFATHPPVSERIAALRQMG